jgi:hypothetical protein
MAVDSLTKTLQANVPQVRRLKILIHGQEVETLAGHLDLSQAFVVNANAPVGPRAATSTSSGQPNAAQQLTPAATNVKLAASPDKPVAKP